MPVTEATRHDLHTRLDEVLGQRQALTLMEHLPPIGWADVATKKDLAELEDRLDMRFLRERERIDGQFAVVGKQFAEVDRRFGEVDRRFDRLERRMLQAIGMGIAALGVLVAALTWLQPLGG